MNWLIWFIFYSFAWVESALHQVTQREPLSHLSRPVNASLFSVIRRVLDSIWIPEIHREIVKKRLHSVKDRFYLVDSKQLNQRSRLGNLRVSSRRGGGSPPTSTEKDMPKDVAVDPRVRMKEVRAYVKNFVGGSNPDGLAHLGEYPKNMDDAVRMIIALQDQLENTMDRHKKASDHVHNLMQMSEMTGQVLMESMFQSFETNESLCAQRDAALALHEKECTAHMETRRQLAEMNSHAAELQQRWQGTLTQLDAAMMTLKTSLNGG